jgi:hypothetical protein
MSSRTAARASDEVTHAVERPPKAKTNQFTNQEKRTPPAGCLPFDAAEAHTQAVSWEVSAAFVVAIAIAAWRAFRRRGGSEWGPMREVADAPSDALPIASPRLNDDGLGTYSLHLGTPEGSKERA